MYVTGDTHGERTRFKYIDRALDDVLTAQDRLFVCGDFGYVMRDTAEEQHYLDDLAQRPYQILFVDGNHENFDLLESYPEEDWCEGKIHVIRRDWDGQPKLIHLMRGHVFHIDGKTIFTMGGGYSRDKEMRIPRKSWWSQEMPSTQEMQRAMLNLAAHDYSVDYILSHTPPESTMIRLGRHPSIHDQPLTGYLDFLQKKIIYKHWWFGHLHLDQETWRQQTAVFFQVRNMETNEACSKL